MPARWGAFCGNALLPALQMPTFINPPALPRRRGRHALRKRSFPRFVNANFYKPPGAPCWRGVGAFQKRGISATFLSGTWGVGVAFAVMESRSRRFGVFLLFVLVRRAVCRFKERQRRGQSGKQSVPAQIPSPIASAVSCAAMSPWRTNGLNETPLPCHRFSKEPVPHHNSKNLCKQACHPDRLVQKPP